MPNSVLAAALPRTIGLTCGWLMLTIRSLTLFFSVFGVAREKWTA